VGVMARAQWSINAHLHLFNSVTLSKTRLVGTGHEFPYVPGVLNVLGISLHSSSFPRKWDWSTNFRVSSSMSASLFDPRPQDRVAGYGVVDTGIEWQFGRSSKLAARVENVFDHFIELKRGYPIRRSASIQVSISL
jgi:hypothetical protein